MKFFFKQVFPAALFCLLLFAIPIEHKYDKFMRFYSLTLIPEGLNVPDSFEKKIYCYPSDVMSLILFGIGFWTVGRRIWGRGMVFLGIMFVGALISIMASPMKNYPVVYVRLWQLLTPMALFTFVANGPIEGKKLFRMGCWSLFASASFQAAVALAQYVRQAGLGWRLLSEQPLGAFIPLPPSHTLCWFGGEAPPFGIFRAMGTMPHPNVLGGFLVLGLLIAMALFAEKKSWWIGLGYLICLCALACTYSRAAIYAWTLGTAAWLGWRKWKGGALVRAPLFLVGSCTLLVGSVLWEQYVHRGGIVTYTPSIQESDRERIHYQRAAFRMMTHSPWVGVGYGQFSCQGNTFLDQGAGAHMQSGGVHNIFLRVGAEMGTVSLAAFFAWLGSVFWAGWKNRTSSEVQLLGAILVAFMFLGCCDHYLILFQQGKLMLFAVVGLLARFGQFEKRSLQVV